MITDKLNRWVTMFVNLSVLAGIVLVAIQIQQNTDITKAQMANEYYLLDAQQVLKGKFSFSNAENIITKITRRIKNPFVQHTQ